MIGEGKKRPANSHSLMKHFKNTFFLSPIGFKMYLSFEKIIINQENEKVWPNKW